MPNGRREWRKRAFTFFYGGQKRKIFCNKYLRIIIIMIISENQALLVLKYVQVTYFIEVTNFIKIIKEKHEIPKGNQNNFKMQINKNHTWERNPFMTNIQKIPFSSS